MNYEQYINSPEWKERSQAIQEARGNRCEHCSISGVEATLTTHHLTYVRLGNEYAEDLVVLCRYCHSCTYYKIPLGPKRNSKGLTAAQRADKKARKQKCRRYREERQMPGQWT